MLNNNDFDRQAEKAMSEHQKFREKHWQYFKTVCVLNTTTSNLEPKPINKELERESMRLFSIACELNRKAEQQ